MAAKGFQAQARQRDGLAVLDLSGDIDRSAETALENAYVEATSGVDAPLLLNFSAVDYINSTGIAVIVGLLARARKEHRPVMACGLSDHYKEIFSITRLSDFMPVLESEDEAVDKAAV